jgi:gamma-glutamyltranspeptidase/glutathione hydrolase
VAAVFTSFIAEYTLSAVGGGGFALVVPAPGQAAHLLDFFSTAPGLGRPQPPALGAIDFQEITVDYGVSQQHFYVGRGAVAVPGNIAGLCLLARQFGRLPLRVLLEPAIRLMREGCPVSEMQAFIGALIEPILLLTPESAAIFGSPDGSLLPVGGLVRMPELAATLERLAVEGPSLFYRGDVAQAILADQQAHGGLLTAADLHRYRVRRTKPLSTPFRGRTVLTNPPPSRGGLLISFALRLLDPFRFDPAGFGRYDHLELLCEAMRVTSLARQELEAQELAPRQQAARLLGAASVRRWSGVLAELLSRPVAERSLDPAIPARPTTTQISAMDADGMVVSLTTSAGEGTGFVVPGTGVILNNMLGEADLHPQGFHQSVPGKRIPSMMAPTVVLENGAPVLALGSGGANRIRSAILQVLLNTLAFDLPLSKAVQAPRVHFEDGLLQVEAGNDAQAVDALETAGYAVNRWRSRHMYFGGVHAVARLAGGDFLAVGDPRRGGAAVSSEQ